MTYKQYKPSAPQGWEETAHKSFTQNPSWTEISLGWELHCEGHRSGLGTNEQDRPDRQTDDPVMSTENSRSWKSAWSGPTTSILTGLWKHLSSSQYRHSCYLVSNLTSPEPYKLSDPTPPPQPSELFFFQFVFLQSWELNPGAFAQEIQYLANIPIPCSFFGTGSHCDIAQVSPRWSTGSDSRPSCTGHGWRDGSCVLTPHQAIFPVSNLLPLRSRNRPNTFSIFYG